MGFHVHSKRLIFLQVTHPLGDTICYNFHISCSWNITFYLDNESWKSKMKLLKQTIQWKEIEVHMRILEKIKCFIMQYSLMNKLHHGFWMQQHAISIFLFLLESTFKSRPRIYQSSITYIVSGMVVVDIAIDWPIIQ